MSTESTYTPCFDWVVRATGSSSAALAYGVIWRYAQMRGARCYASSRRLSGELGWTRQRIARHIHILLSHRLIRCTNPDALGVPHEYEPVSREEWAAARTPEPPSPPTPDPQPATLCDTPPVTSHDTPCHETSPQPVTIRDTRNTTRNTNRKPKRARPSAAPLPGNAHAVTCGLSGPEPATRNPQPRRANPQPITHNPQPRHGRPPDPRTHLPAMQLFRRITGAYPPKVLYDQVLATLGTEPDENAVKRCYQAWCARGYNPRSLVWLLEWYANGVAGTGGPPCPPTRNPQPGTRNPPLNAGPPTSPDDFTRWQEYQQSVQKGDDPDETKRRLGL